jgi:hypothetical protein
MLGRQQPLLRRFLASLDHIQASVHPAKNAFLQQQLREATPDPIQPDGGLGAMSEELRALGKPAWTGRLADTLNSLGSATELWLADGAELEQLPKRETAQARLDIWSLRAHVPQVAAHWAADAAACAAELSGHAATEQRSDYVLLMPRAQAVAEPMPLVVALHGGCSRYTRAPLDLLLCAAVRRSMMFSAGVQARLRRRGDGGRLAARDCRGHCRCRAGADGAKHRTAAAAAALLACLGLVCGQWSAPIVAALCAQALRDNSPSWGMLQPERDMRSVLGCAEPARAEPGALLSAT